MEFCAFIFLSPHASILYPITITPLTRFWWFTRWEWIQLSSPHVARYSYALEAMSSRLVFVSCHLWESESRIKGIYSRYSSVRVADLTTGLWNICIVPNRERKVGDLGFKSWYAAEWMSKWEHTCSHTAVCLCLDKGHLLNYRKQKWLPGFLCFWMIAWDPQIPEYIIQNACL